MVRPAGAWATHRVEAAGLPGSWLRLVLGLAGAIPTPQLEHGLKEKPDSLT